MSVPALRARPSQPGTGVAGPWQMAGRAFKSWLVNYRRTWRGSIYSSVLMPVLYLGAMGLGLGTLVNKHGTAGLGGVSYVVFLAPGLMAATAMQTAVAESLYPVYSAVKWQQTYQAAAATPLKPGDIFRGHLLFTAMRLAMNMIIFLAIMSLFGAVNSAWAVAAVPVAVLTGLAFATPLDAFAVSQKNNDQAFAMIFRFGMIPLFLFSGTFFPVTQLPGWIRPLAYATPLWHGVALCRALSLGSADLVGSLGHIAYLIAIAILGLIAGERAYRRRLHV
ncbi:MAG TPA: ABC transporter permease [Streptosporangiaceae bacterium]|nr:ABC transporter permease [Streptosporangiaceae bacterium]